MCAAHFRAAPLSTRHASLRPASVPCNAAFFRRDASQSAFQSGRETETARAGLFRAHRGAHHGVGGGEDPSVGTEGMGEEGGRGKSGEETAMGGMEGGRRRNGNDKGGKKITEKGQEEGWWRGKKEKRAKRNEACLPPPWPSAGAHLPFSAVGGDWWRIGEGKPRVGATTGGVEIAEGWGGRLRDGRGLKRLPGGKTKRKK